MSKRKQNGIYFILGIAIFVFLIYSIANSKIVLIILGSLLGVFLIAFIILRYFFKRYEIFKKDNDNIQKKSNYVKAINPRYLENEGKKKYISKACIMSNYEKEIFSNVNIAVSDIPDLIVLPQVNLASIITKIKVNAWEYQNELYRNIDFGIFTKDYEPKIMIELNDKTHAAANRYERDLKVRNILSEARIPLITLYSSYPNKPEYIKQRIIEALSEKISA